MSDDVSCPLCGAPYASPKARAQHEAYKAAAKRLKILCDKGGTANLDDWTEAEDDLAALRAAGIQIEGEGK